MAPRLESLPGEILDYILGYLIGHPVGTLRREDKIDCLALSHLSQCSRFLSQRLEHILFGTTGTLLTANRHGCMTGNLHALRKAAAHGAPPGVVRHSGMTYVEGVDSYHRTYARRSSLLTALEFGQAEAFDLLLELGAGFDARDYNGLDGMEWEWDLLALAQKLAEPQHEAQLTAFVRATAETPSWGANGTGREEHSQASAVVTKMPLGTMVLTRSLKFLRVLFEQGRPWRVNWAMVQGLSSGPDRNSQRPLTPLSAACLRGDMAVFELVRAAGAQVDFSYTLREQHASKHSHIPIFMAAEYMATSGGDTRFLDICVAAGADINQTCHSHPSTGRRLDWHRQRPPHVCTTPLLTYLDAAFDLQEQPVPPADQDEDVSRAPRPQFKTTALTPREGVAYLVSVHGARATSPNIPPRASNLRYPAVKFWDRVFGAIPSPVELLLAKHGICTSLEDPAFFSVIKLLLSTEGAANVPDMVRTMVRFDSDQAPRASDEDARGSPAPPTCPPSPPPPPPPPPPHPSSAQQQAHEAQLWEQRFLPLYKPMLSSLSSEERALALRQLVLDKVRLRIWALTPGKWLGLRAVGRASIRFLVEAGADINYVHVSNKDNSEGYIKHDNNNSSNNNNNNNNNNDERCTSLGVSPRTNMCTRETGMNLLHKAIHEFVLHGGGLGGDQMHDHPAGYACAYTGRVARAMGEFLLFLIGLGADPERGGVSGEKEQGGGLDNGGGANPGCSHDTDRHNDHEDDDGDDDDDDEHGHATPADALLALVAQGRVRYPGGTLEQALMYLVTVLRQRRLPELGQVERYSGKRKQFREHSRTREREWWYQPGERGCDAELDARVAMCYIEGRGG
ncbi:uncharacterized protein B0I36DRAFT_353537 [Microdochium trichocladiopsis]|uniref:Ankyrin repeat-containing domain protein n=1 Tax=Microdochium trichocladiopsis TaxID=1682393 RepID=A0A9P8XV78_9PEZI|nr:uncharacterized protein B0I36DRAFT_353537 [Microdochium trichocladiopsis]KAH7020793.1 hypothetical protein B0I36DRAFT_353537 [Microdochium trichocladiopsis]